MTHRQGSLDCLCGMYAIINAVNALYGLDQRDAMSLFKSLLSVDKNKAVLYATRGIHYPEMKKLSLEAAKWLKRQKIGNVLVDFPHENKIFAGPRDWIEDVKYMMDSRPTSAVVCLTTTIDHAVALVDINEVEMTFVDSGVTSREVVDRRDIALTGDMHFTKWFVEPEHTIVFQKPYK